MAAMDRAKRYMIDHNQHHFLYNGFKANQRFPKKQLFKRSEPFKEIICLPINSTGERWVQGTSFEETTKSFALSVNVDASYASMFSASVQTDFQEHGANSKSTAMSKQTCEWQIARFYLNKKELTPEADRALNRNSSSGWEKALIRDFGEVYAEGVHVGAKMEMYWSTESTKATSCSSMLASVDVSAAAFNAKLNTSTKVNTMKTSKLGGDKVNLVITAEGGDSTTWDWTQGIKNPQSAQPKWIESAKRDPHIIHAELNPIWDLIVDDRRKEAVKKELLKLQENVIKHGDHVYIRSKKGTYIADTTTSNGYALLSKRGSDKAKFKVEFAGIQCSNSMSNDGIRLSHVGHGFAYSQSYNYLYASTSGWRYACFDQLSANTKQLWVPQAADDRRDLSKQGQLEYNKPIILRDAFVHSVLCTCECCYDTSHDYLCSQYETARDYFDPNKRNHCMHWVLERAEPRGQKRSSSSL